MSKIRVDPPGIPAEMGYGRFSQPGIPGGSTLIFDIELLGVN